MRWRKIAFWSVFSLLSLLVLLISWLWVADLGVIRPQLEAFISEKTGRELKIAGNFQVDLARTSVVIAENVTFQNSDWADEPYMLSVGRIEVQLDTRSLLGGPIVFELIDIKDTEIFLERPEDGDPNWEIPFGEPAQEEKEESAGIDILFRKIDIDRVHLVHTAPHRNRPIDIRIEYLDQMRRDDHFLELALAGSVDDREIALTGELGTWDALLAGKDFSYDLDVVLDTFELTSSGQIDDVANLRRPSIEFTAYGPSVDDLTRLLAVGEAGEGDINLEGSLRPQQDGPLVLSVGGNLGMTEIEASGAFSDLKDFENIDFDVLATGPDFGRIIRLAGIQQVREAPFMIDINAERRGRAFVVSRANMLFGDAQFTASANVPDFPSVDDARIKLNITGPDIERFRYIFKLPGAATGAFNLDFEIDVTPDGVELVNLRVVTSLGRVTADGKLGPPPKYIGSQFDVTVTSDSLAIFAGAYGLENLPDYPFTVEGKFELEDGSIRTRGPVTATIEDIVANVDGRVQFASRATGSDFTFGVTGPDLADLVSAFTQAPGIPAQPYDINGRLQIRDDGLRFRGVGGKVGSSSVKFDGLLAMTKRVAGSRFDFVLKGPAFEEAIAEIGDLEVRPGEYTLSGRVGLEADMVSLDNIKLDRERGDLAVNLDIGLPASRRWMNFDVQGRGKDVGVVLGGIKNFEAAALPFSLDFEGRQRGNNWAFDRLEIGVGDALVEANGDLELADTANHTDFRMVGTVPSLASLGQWKGRTMRDQDFAWNAHVVGGDGVLSIDNLAIKLGDSDVNGSIRYEKGDVPQLNVDVYAESVFLTPLLDEGEPEYDPEPKFKDGKLIPDIQVPFDAMRKLNASLRFDLGELSRDNLYMRNFKLHADLVDGALNLSEFSFLARSGALRAKALLEPAGGNGHAQIQLVARDFAFGSTEMNQDMAMTGDIDINLESTGNDLRTLIGNLTGIFYVNALGGRILNNRFLQAIYGDLLDQIFGAINPFYKQEPFTNLKCVVLPVRIEDGQLGSVPNTYVGTDKVRMTFKSKINLKTEKIDMTIRTTPQKTLGISAGELLNPYIKIVGSLGAPSLAVDEAGVLISGGAAVATAGLSVLAKAAWDRVSRAPDPCEKTAQEATEKLGEFFPDLTLATIGQAAEEVSADE